MKSPFTDAFHGKQKPGSLDANASVDERAHEGGRTSMSSPSTSHGKKKNISRIKQHGSNMNTSNSCDLPQRQGKADFEYNYDEHYEKQDNFPPINLVLLPKSEYIVHNDRELQQIAKRLY